MAIKIRNAALLLVICAGLLSNPPDLSSCGPWLPTAAFSFWKMPEDAAGRFARGQLGILQPGFPRFYLIIAYRYLTGVGLNAAERTALFGPETVPVGATPPSADSVSPSAGQPPDGVEEWRKARARVIGNGAHPQINLFKTISGNSYFLIYLNCRDDAFFNAAKTLDDRVRQLGLQNPALKDWVAAQDQVFANCSGGPSIPAPLDDAATPLMRADRTYQIAAANFYAGDIETAERMFRAIAEDRGSPWSSIAPYLVARSIIREATLSVKGEGADREKLMAAEAQLQAIVHDPARSAWHPAARRLLDYVGVRLAPGERMHHLAEALVLKDSQGTIEQNVFDYRFLYDQYERGNFGGLQTLPDSDEMTAWILAYQSTGPDAAAKAAGEWHVKETLPWLVVALTKARGDQSDAGELIAAARKIGRDSPAYETVAFHSIRLLIESQHIGEARSQLDKLLAPEAAALATSSRNLFRAERLKIAANWDEFLKYAARNAAGTAYGFEQYTGDPKPESEDPTFPQQIGPRRPGLDVDAAKILNEQTPHDLLLEAGRRDTLPSPVRREVAVSGWVRSVLLGDEKTAILITPILQELAPELKQPLQVYLDASNPRARTFAAVFLILKFPGMRPYVQTGFGRLQALGKLDNLRDNWWCPFAPGLNISSPGYYRQASILTEPLRLLYPDGAPQAQFLSADDLARGRREWSELSKMAPAPEYLAGQTVEWARSNPNDARAPEALHLAVRAARYGCEVGKAGSSKEAFQLLHRRYPDSEWALKTKYYY
jgi:hypothetical protein